MSKMDFAALLCSRLCHDLVSPVGAIANGIEILNEEHDTSMREQVMELLQHSALQTSNKLQFFRLAFGAAGGFSKQLELQEAEAAIKQFLSGSKVTASMGTDLHDAPKDVVKAMLNLVLVACETLIRGGHMHICVHREADSIIIDIMVEGTHYILQEQVRAALEGHLSEAEVEPRSAPAFLVSTLASELGGTVTLDDIDDTKHRFVLTMTGI